MSDFSGYGYGSSEICRLNSETSTRLRQGQNITKTSDVVRELVDNAIDAGAKKVQVLLDDFGLDKIEVRDDGHGICREAVSKVIRGGFTSKLLNDEHISRTEDNYGFRGEALSSICTYASTSIFTKTESDTFGTKYGFNDKGQIVEEARGPLPTKSGTHIIVKNLFTKYPVRRNYIKEKSKRISDLKEIESFIRSIGLANPKVSITLIHNGCSVFSKPSVQTTDQALVTILGINISKQMKKLGPVSEPDFTMELFVPKLPVDLKVMTMSSCKMCFIFINRKRVRIKEFETILQHQVLGSVQGTSKHPYFILTLQVPFTEVDFNRETDKSKVFLVKKDEICTKLESVLQEYYKKEEVGISNNNNSEPAIQEPSATPNPSLALRNTELETNFQCSPPPQISESERNENVISFLSNIPTMNNFNFTQSPKKTPGFEKTSFGSICSTPSPTTRNNLFNTSSSSPCSTSRSPSTTSCSTPTIAKEFGLSYNNSSISESTPLRKLNWADAPSKSTSLHPNAQKDWVYGQIKDAYGGFIQSTTLHTRRDTNPNSSSITTIGCKNNKKLVTAASPTDFNRRIRSGFEEDEPPTKRAKSLDNGYGFSNRPQSERTRLGFDCRSPHSGNRNSTVARGPRQVTLDSLKSWHTPGDKLAKSNVIYSTPSPKQLTGSGSSRLLMDVDNSDIVICGSAQRKTILPQNNLNPIFGKELSSSPVFLDTGVICNRTVTPTESRSRIEPSRINSAEKSTCFLIPESPPIIEFSKPFSTRSTKASARKDPKLVNYTGTHGLSKGISSYELIRSPPRLTFCESITTTFQQTQEDDDHNLIPTITLISCLPGTTLYIVKINEILGVFNPLNLLELEPQLKSELGVLPSSFSKDTSEILLSDQSVKFLLDEFTGLSTDDYTEEMVQSIFHVLHNFSGDEDLTQYTETQESQEETNILF